MKPKLVILLVALTLLPLSALTWLGVRLDQQEAERVQRELDELLVSRLHDVEADVTRFLEARERLLLTRTETLPDDIDGIRRWARHEPLMRHVLVLDPQGRLLFPPFDGPLSAAERAFRERTRRIWTGRALAHQALREGGHGPAGQGSLASASQSEASPAAPTAQWPPQRRDHGWYTWYWANGLNLIFWRRTPTGRVIGVEMDRVRMLADVIAILPATAPVPPSGRGAGASTTAADSIALFDANAEIVYRWGDYTPPEDATPRARLTLHAPLSAWHLELFMPVGAATAGGQWAMFDLLTGLLAVGLVLVGLAIYFYRESAREMREAALRVSFVNKVSHELKTPLTNIRMYAELLDGVIEEVDDEDLQGRDEPLDDRPRRYLGIIVSESQRLSRLIGNILTFARKQRQKLVLRAAPESVDEVIYGVLAQFEPALAAKGLAVEVRANAGQTAMVDADAVGQILGNLLSNVEKYAAAGKGVIVTSTIGAGRTTITVADDGPGIPRKQAERVFQPFFRIRDRLTDGVTGTGIGLSIARELARLHGGELVLVPADQGACFRLEIATPTPDGPVI